MENFKREDYVYLRVVEDYEDKDGIKYKKGTILRYRKEWLIENIHGRQFGYVFDWDNELIYEENDQCDENDVLYHKIYKSITVSKDRNYKLLLWPGDYFYLNDWLYKHIDDKGIYTITNAQKKLIFDRTNSTQFIELMEGYPNRALNAHIFFKKGEVLDFSDPAVASLFYNMEWIKFFTKTEVISDKEKQQLFDEDFSNAIYAQNPSTASIWRDDPNYDLHEYHYFKIKGDIQVKARSELKKMFGIELPYSVNFMCDEEGFIKWISTDTSCDHSSHRDTEQLILQFADRLSVDDAHECHRKLIADYIKQREEQYIKLTEKMEKQRIELQGLYESKKNNPLYFPGVNGYFVHNDNESKRSEKEKYTLSQIKEFYQKLKTLNPDVVKELCFYGGTIPYVLNGASESRDFGDIDIFVPVPQMEKLREELAKEDSFEMMCDSKPLAQFCQLTSRIQKKSTELIDESGQKNELLGLILNAVLAPQCEDIIDVDQNEDTSNMAYYNKIQDFGFKAKLFGINISVFPIYQYKDNIMAKSFSINEMYKFLLGVRILDNANIDQFVKNIEIYDSAFKVVPLEYTLVSKKSAVDGNYSSRLEKDSQDIEYILSHKEELGLDDEKIQEILSRYPDYSISIAYRVNSNGTTTTMSGEAYKELVLTNRSIS